VTSRTHEDQLFRPRRDFFFEPRRANRGNPAQVGGTNVPNFRLERESAPAIEGIRPAFASAVGKGLLMPRFRRQKSPSDTRSIP
jgi:hypothetical protein